VGSELFLHLVTGRAMSPVLPHRSLVGVERCGVGEVDPGDIVACEEGGRVVLSRLLAMGAGGALRCSSDHDGRARLVPAAALLGRAIWRSHHGSLALLGGAKTPPGIFPRRSACRMRETPATDAELCWILESFRAALEGTAAPKVARPDRFGWYRCIELALNHRVDGLLFPCWRDLPEPEGPDAAARAMIEGTSREAGRRWEEGLEVLRLVVPALDRAGIPFLVLKGPILASECYAHPGERPFTDLDLLVAPRDRRRALEALEGEGCAPKVGAAGRRFVEWGHFHLVLTPPPPLRLVVEMHWDLVDRATLFTIDVEEALSRARRVRLPGVTVSALDPVDEFLYLCVHLSRHGVMNRKALAAGLPATWFVRGESGNRLIWFLDLVRHAARHGAALAPSIVRERAESWNATATLEECLLLAERIVGNTAALEPLLRGVVRGPDTATEDARRVQPGAQPLSPLRLWAMRPLAGLVVRPVRLLELLGLFFPGPAAIRRYYRTHSAAGTAVRCALHPLSMAWKLLGGKSRAGRRRGPTRNSKPDNL